MGRAAVQSSIPGARGIDSQQSPELRCCSQPKKQSIVCCKHVICTHSTVLSCWKLAWLITSLTPLFSLQWRTRNFSQKLFNLRKKELLKGLFSQHCPCFSTCFKLFLAITLLFMLIAACSSLFSGVFKRGCCYKKGSLWRRCQLLHFLPHSSQLFRCHSNWLLLKDRKFAVAWSFAFLRIF